MEKSNSDKKVRMRCPECLNFMNAIVCDNGAMKGICHICKSTIFSKQHSVKEKHIKIIRN